MEERVYPSVEIDSASMSDVRCLMDLYAGGDSELGAIMQYIYQSYVLHEVNGELAEVLRELACDEMEHHRLLGETITSLGGTPVMGGNRQFWNGAMLNYTKDIVAMLEWDIRAERVAIEEYQKASKCVDNYTIKELISAIIAVEQEHLAILERERAKINTK